MKAFVASVLVALAVGVAAALVLNLEQRPAYEAFATGGARVSDPGSNLVGPTWSGNNAADKT